MTVSGFWRGKWLRPDRPPRPPVQSTPELFETDGERRAQPIVDYEIVRNDWPQLRGLAFNYLFGMDGVYVVASHPLFSARVPVARCEIRGLRAIGSQFTLVHGKVPGVLWDELMHHADDARFDGHEVLVAIAHTADRGYHLVVPQQKDSAWSVEYDPQVDQDWLLEVHSHRDAAARPSSIDNRDEQRLRLYGVVGRLNKPRPQVSLRCGVYGYWLPLPWADVFDGDPDAIDDQFQIGWGF